MGIESKWEATIVTLLPETSRNFQRPGVLPVSQKARIHVIPITFRIARTSLNPSGPSSRNTDWHVPPVHMAFFFRHDPLTSHSSLLALCLTSHPLRSPLSLGTRAKIPSRYMLNTLRTQTTCVSDMPSDQMLNTFRMCPAM